MALILVTILWIVYSILEGYREAFYFFFETEDLQKKVTDLHPYFACQRIIVGGLSAFIAVGLSNVLFTLICLVSLGLMFTFLHDGMYYAQRNNLNKETYPKRWFDYSTTSTAKLDKFLNPTNRIIMFIVGIGGLAYLLLK